MCGGAGKSRVLEEKGAQWDVMPQTPPLGLISRLHRQIPMEEMEESMFCMRRSWSQRHHLLKDLQYQTLFSACNAGQLMPSRVKDTSQMDQWYDSKILISQETGLTAHPTPTVSMIVPLYISCTDKWLLSFWVRKSKMPFVVRANSTLPSPARIL